ncbi:uncharacterized protein Z518_06218 [Rhinocladiella mackenziei CBS 650.93]|uniref:Rhinocladiella mackenziei CBS 650.93 unplaced genomic scaffold supercont1.4, whole genome shotgun sequence n=1 Tax=Rhinocladiella mackenziei CBS 650.93 TaxID=1442369 RepID=A0A0D2IQ78_9EURO|nr:uncharacterized protein Z518_06218 [Rhinocladiella mackenziei CBS 650.93]KIX05346.1 hypothetical protein Z518_06218 [Rhinocladiella mackenziei CBS 650.93]
MRTFHGGKDDQKDGTIEKDAKDRRAQILVPRARFLDLAEPPAEAKVGHGISLQPSGQVSGLSDQTLTVDNVDQAATTTTPNETFNRATAEVNPGEEEDNLRPVRGRKYLREIKLPKRFPKLLEVKRKLGRAYPFSRVRHVVSTELLTEELRWVSRYTPHPDAIRNILRILIQDRKVKPTSDHYEALILGNCFPEHGSADNVKVILQEMEREGIPIEAHVCGAVLMVLTVHPDTQLRTSILQRLSQLQTFSADEYAELSIAAMIREDQLEMATVQLERLQKENRNIGKWTWIMYIHAVCDRHDFDALLQLLYRLSDSRFLFPRPTLLHLLVTASENGNMDVTKWVWHGYVEGMHIIPNEAICMSVLRLAADNRDLNLAESVGLVLQSVAGDTMTIPPSLMDLPQRSTQWTYKKIKDEKNSLTFDSPDLLEFPTGSHPPSSNQDTDAENNPISDISSESLAVAFSTPPALRPAALTAPRRPPTEALRIFADLGIDAQKLTAPLRTDKRGRGNLFPLFRKETGLRGARFDPRLALMETWDWKKK